MRPPDDDKRSSEHIPPRASISWKQLSDVTACTQARLRPQLEGRRAPLRTGRHLNRKNPTMPSSTLFEPYTLGKLQLRNRIVMAPMTRSRAVESNTANQIGRASCRERV